MYVVFKRKYTKSFSKCGATVGLIREREREGGRQFKIKREFHNARGKEDLQEITKVFLDRVMALEQSHNVPLMIVLNKCDLLDAPPTVPDQKVSESECSGGTRKKKTNGEDHHRLYDSEDYASDSTTANGREEEKNEKRGTLLPDTTKLGNVCGLESVTEMDEENGANGWTTQDDEEYESYKAYGWDVDEEEEVDVHRASSPPSSVASSRSSRQRFGGGALTRAQRSQRLRDACQARCEPVHRADMAVFSISALKAVNIERCRKWLSQQLLTCVAPSVPTSSAARA